MDEQIKNAAVKKSKKLLWKIIFAICTSSVFLWMLLFIVIIAFIMATAEAINQKNNSDESVVWSEKVLKYEDEIAEYCATYDIGAYKYHIMAIMQVSTDGEGKDPMAASDIAGYEIKSSKESIEIGVQEFAQLLKLVGVSGVSDTDKLLTVYQVYHLGRDYYTYLNGRGHTQQLAVRYIYDNGITGKTSYFADNVALLLKRAETARKNASSTGGGDDTVFIWPTLPEYQTISSNYGSRICPYHGKEFHSGIDIVAPSGVEIYAVKSGKVITAQYHSSYGNYIIIDHGNNIYSQYNHASSLTVAVGDIVSQGQVIAYVGSTGDSTGAHLDFRIITSGGFQNPLEYVTPAVNINNMPKKSIQNGIDAGLPNEKICWDYMKACGFTDVQAAAMMGNIWRESRFSSGALEGNGVGLGICQWSWTRRTEYENYAASVGKNPLDLEPQLEYMVKTLVRSQFLPQKYYDEWKTGDIDTATKAIQNGWLRPPVDCSDRQRMAHYYYNLYAGK